MGAGAVFGEGDGLVAIDQGVDVELDGERGTILNGEVAGKRDACAEWVACEVVGVALERWVGCGMETAFECQENVTAEPAPVKSIEVWVQRVIGRVGSRVAGILGRVQSDMELQSLIVARGDIINRQAILFGERV